jgi:hypothetical protein
MTELPANNRCRHGMLPKQCSACRPRPAYVAPITPKRNLKYGPAAIQYLQSFLDPQGITGPTIAELKDIVRRYLRHEAAFRLNAISEERREKAGLPYQKWFTEGQGDAEVIQLRELLVSLGLGKRRANFGQRGLYGVRREVDIRPDRVRHIKAKDVEHDNEN